MREIPASVSDVLLHDRDSEKSERVILPITRYDNIMNAPKVVHHIDSVKGAPFILYTTDTEWMSTEEIRKLGNGII